MVFSSRGQAYDNDMSGYLIKYTVLLFIKQMKAFKIKLQMSLSQQTKKKVIDATLMEKYGPI